MNIEQESEQSDLVQKLLTQCQKHLEEAVGIVGKFADLPLYEIDVDEIDLAASDAHKVMLSLDEVADLLSSRIPKDEIDLKRLRRVVEFLR
jgi:hypothetical protein